MESANGQFETLSKDSSKPIDDQIKSMTVLSKKVGEMTLPITKKNALQANIDAKIKALHQDKKAEAQKVKKEALAKGKEIAAAITGKVLVQVINTWGANNNALTELSTAILADKPEVSLFLCATDATSGKGLAMSFVPKGAVCNQYNLSCTAFSCV